ncbi:hypothetical protein O4H26_08000 [Aequorivita viscosa]|nr:hypothetical protein [Aequorivita viscosa]
MRFNYLKILILSFFSSLCIGCSAVRVTDAQSQVVRPGLPSTSPTISYSWKLLVKKPIELKSITLNKLNIETDITSYSISDLSDGRIINSKLLQAGNYFINFKIPGNKLDPDEENIIKFEYTDNTGANTISFKSIKIPDLLMK